MLVQILGVFSLIALYFVFVPAPVEVHPYHDYQSPADFSPYLKPDRFQQIQLIQSPELQNPEDIQIDPQTGDIYTGNSKGTIFRITPDRKRQVFIQGRGPILRIELDKKNDRIYYIDSGRGICRAKLSTKQVETLVGYESYGCLNSFDIGKDGRIYFTETSSKFRLPQIIAAYLAGQPDGNVYLYDPETNQTKKIIDKLYCTNGIEVSPDGSSLYISEFGRYRIIRYDLKKGNVETVIDNLEGLPDNLRFNQKGQLWVGLPLMRDGFQEFLLQNQWARNLLIKLPSSLLNKLGVSFATGAMKISTKGEVLDYIKEDTSKYAYLSTAMEYKGKLYLASYGKPAIAIVPVEGSGSKPKEEEL